jgi:hypothetical protein
LNDPGREKAFDAVIERASGEMFACLIGGRKLLLLGRRLRTAPAKFSPDQVSCG